MDLWFKKKLPSLDLARTAGRWTPWYKTGCRTAWMSHTPWNRNTKCRRGTPCLGCSQYPACKCEKASTGFRYWLSHHRQLQSRSCRTGNSATGHPGSISKSLKGILPSNTAAANCQIVVGWFSAYSQSLPSTTFSVVHARSHFGKKTVLPHCCQFLCCCRTRLAKFFRISRWGFPLRVNWRFYSQGSPHHRYSFGQRI